MTIIDLLLLVLASFTLVDLLFNSDLFAVTRMQLQSWQDFPDAAPWLLRNRVGRFFVNAANCPYCSSFHASWICLLCWLHPIGQFVITVLAIENLVWLLHGFLPEKFKLDRNTKPVFTTNFTQTTETHPASSTNDNDGSRLQ